ncbi:MAG: biopolymer transporter ExbD [Myxococcales bacterium]|nr:biopolymer transporter ExbD [Myxococcales bacterium]
MAGGAMGGGDDDGIVGINVTPLVDIMLVLLIIFMVASSYIVQNSIEVDLPKAATGGETLDTTLSVVIKPDGSLFLNGEEATEEAIAEKCRRAAAKAEAEKQAAQPGQQVDEPQAIIAADKNVSHGKVVRIIDLVRKNGVIKFAINIDPEALEESK